MQAAVIQKVRIRSPDPVSGFPHHDKVASFSKLDEIVQKWLLTVLSVSVSEAYFPATFADNTQIGDSNWLTIETSNRWDAL